MASDAPSGGPAADDAEVGVGRSGGLAGLTPSGRAVVPVAWSLYDFANTIFSYAVVSTAIGLWLTDDSRFGQGLGQLVQGITIAVSVGLNALVSPILGALSDRGGRRLPFLLFFTVLTIVPTLVIGPSPALVGAALFTLANFAYQAALIYYDATLSIGQLSRRRAASCRGSASASGTWARSSPRLTLLLLGITETPDPIFLHRRCAVRDLRGPDLPGRAGPPQAPRPRASGSATSRRRSAQIRVTIDHARTVPGLLRFLLGRFFYSDAVNTLIVVMSVVAVRGGRSDPGPVAHHLGRADGRRDRRELRAGARLSTGSARSGRSSWSSRRGSSGLVLGVASLGVEWHDAGIAIFVIAGAILGSGLGGVQVADRVFMIRLSPPARLGEFFGLYGLVGKGSQVIGQLLFGVILFLFFDSLGNGAYQIAILSLLVTMLIGLWLVWPVSDAGRAATTRRMAGRMPSRSCRPSGSRRRTPRSNRASQRAGLRAGSVRVAVRVSLAPGPGRADHRLERRMRGLPAEHVGRPLGAKRRGPAGRLRAAVPTANGIDRPTTASAAATTSRIENPPPMPRLQASELVGPSGRRGPSPRSPAGARRRGPRRGCSRGCTSRRASGSRRRRPSAAGRPRPPPGRSG